MSTKRGEIDTILILLFVIVAAILATTWLAYRYKKKLLQTGMTVTCADCSATWYFTTDGILKKTIMRNKVLKFLAMIGEAETRLLPMPTVLDDGSSQCPRCGSTNIRVSKKHKATNDDGV